MKAMKSRPGLRRKCGICRSRDIEITSGHDGRRKWRCQCGNEWTEGDHRKRRPGASVASKVPIVIKLCLLGVHVHDCHTCRAGIESALDAAEARGREQAALAIKALAVEWAAAPDYRGILTPVQECFEAAARAAMEARRDVRPCADCRKWWDETALRQQSFCAHPECWTALSRAAREA